MEISYYQEETYIMPRPRKYTSPLTKYRMNKGWHTSQIALEALVSHYTVTRIENGQPVSRVFVARYLHALEIDLNNPATLPAGWSVEDQGEKVVILGNN